MTGSNRPESQKTQAELDAKRRQLKNLALQIFVEDKKKEEKSKAQTLTLPELNSHRHQLKVLAMQLQVEDLDPSLAEKIAHLVDCLEKSHYSNMASECRVYRQKIREWMSAIATDKSLAKMAPQLKWRLNVLLRLARTVLSAEKVGHRFIRREERLRDRAFKAQAEKPLPALRDFYVKQVKHCLDVIQAAKNEMDLETVPQVSELVHTLERLDGAALDKKMVATIDEINRLLEFVKETLEKPAEDGLCSAAAFHAIEDLLQLWSRGPAAFVDSPCSQSSQAFFSSRGAAPSPASSSADAPLDVDSFLQKAMRFAKGYCRFL